MNQEEKEHKYDVALSFAGEDSVYVAAVARTLKSRGIDVFYDDYEKVDLWGKNLYTHLSAIYKDASKYVVMFISKHYAKKVWTNHERESAQARAFKEGAEYILPARFDTTEIPGVLETVGYIDLQKLKPNQLASLIESKLDLPKSRWVNEIELAARYCNKSMSEAHRGAFKWADGISVVFENRAHWDEKYLLEFESRIDNELVLARISGGDTCNWMMLIDDGNVDIINDLLWALFANQYSQSSSGKIIFDAQYEIAQKAIGSSNYKSVRDIFTK